MAFISALLAAAILAAVSSITRHLSGARDIPFAAFKNASGSGSPLPTSSPETMASKTSRIVRAFKTGFSY
jgi:hypothetical protein